MNRVVFIVDGFNMYHSLIEAERDSSAGTKWLDLKKLCSSFLPIAAQTGAERAELESIYYFSASPTHRKQDKVDRHSLYMRCLRSSGVTVQLGRFKRKSVYCNKCNKVFNAHEEKESDVAIAIKLFEVCHLDQCDTAILMTGDTDLSPAVVTCRRLFPSKLIYFAFPYRRTNAELAKIASESFSIKLKSYKRCQFDNPIVLPGGKEIKKPDTW
ncbi:MAG: NYN domain-containing protein [Planctomycetota bacterium]|jgi:uncharacterized LabA/DUF88 family protein